MYFKNLTPNSGKKSGIMQGLVPNQMRGSPFENFSVCIIAVHFGRHRRSRAVDIGDVVWRGMDFTQKKRMERISEPWLNLLFKGGM